MPDSIKLPGYRWFSFLGNVPVRIGIYTGACLSLFFSLWLLIANRAPFLEPFALERNIAGVVVLIFLASIPALRFYRAPADLLLAGLLAWALLTVTYGLLCQVYVLLAEKYSAFHIFVLGAVVYMILATLSWIGTIIRRARSAHLSHPHH
jgi:hypothetical protein